MQQKKIDSFFKVTINHNEKKQIRFMNIDIYKILSFSLKNTEGKLNTNI
jgi:hypothetical protein